MTEDQVSFNVHADALKIAHNRTTRFNLSDDNRASPNMKHLGADTTVSTISALARRIIGVEEALRIGLANRLLKPKRAGLQ